MAKAAKNDKKKKDDEPEVEAGEGAEGEEGEPKKKKLSGKALILFIVLPAILVLGAGGAAAFFLLSGQPPEQHAEEAAGHAKGAAKGGSHGGGGGSHGGGAEGDGEGVTITEGNGVVFVALPEILVNITTADGRPAYLKLRLTLEAANHDVVSALEPQLPRVTDQFTSFLRELRTDDLAGSAGSYRLRLELMRRVNLVIAPSQINAVLIEEMLVQ